MSEAERDQGWFGLIVLDNWNREDSYGDAPVGFGSLSLHARPR